MAVTSMKTRAVIHRLVYNAGRILTYAVMGAIVSSAGAIFPIGKFQNLITVLLGIAMLIIGFSGMQKIQMSFPGNLAIKLTTTLKTLFARYLKTKTIPGIMALGALNGLLPCGLSLIALTWCLTLKGPLDGFNFMLFFGAGTLPVMIGFTGALSLIVKKFNWSIRKVTTSMIILSGCTLIARVFIVHLPHAKEAGGGLMDVLLCR
jgi:hypothetical protein